MVPLMMNRQDVFISGETWVHAMQRFPGLPFERFWWGRVRKYDVANQASEAFWRSHDLTNRQVERVLFGAGASAALAEDDIGDDEAVAIALGQAACWVDREGRVVVPKQEDVGFEWSDMRRVYRHRVLRGELPLVPSEPVIPEPRDSAEEPLVEVVDVEEFVERVAKVLVKAILYGVVTSVAEDVCAEVRGLSWPGRAV